MFFVIQELSNDMIKYGTQLICVYIREGYVVELEDWTFIHHSTLSECIRDSVPLFPV